MTSFETWLREAADSVGPDGLLSSEEDTQAYDHDEFADDAFVCRPRAVVKPSTTDQVARIVQGCARHGVPLTARGGGTGLAAACVPSPDGVVMSMERMKTIVDRDPANSTLTVQAGVTLAEINEAAAAMGLFFPPHPGDESAMAGGMVATNAGGARAVKYGTIRRFVLGLQVVTASGQTVELGGRYLKSSTGYSLMDLMFGSEGTLGIITEVTLALMPRPGAIQTLLAPFASVTDAIRSVPAVLDKGIVPFAVEFVERSAIRCAERLVNKVWPAKEGRATLLFMLDGRDEQEVLTLAERIGEVMENQGALDLLLADHEERQKDILEIRSMIYEALRPGTVELFDVCVPRGDIAGHVEFVHGLEERIGMPLPTYGHAADGNVHTNAMRQQLDDGVMAGEVDDWRAKHREVRQAIFDDVIRRRGVVSGEHGIGLAKRDYLVRNLGEPAVAMMRAVKQALDPQGILNPGKVLPS